MICKDDFRTRVRIELLKRGQTIPEFSRKIGKSREAVSAVLNNRRNLPVTKRLICESLGLEDS